MPKLIFYMFGHELEYLDDLHKVLAHNFRYYQCDKKSNSVTYLKGNEYTKNGFHLVKLSKRIKGFFYFTVVNIKIT